MRFLRKSVLKKYCTPRIVILVSFTYLLPLARVAEAVAFQNPLRFRTIEELLVAILDAVVMIMFSIVILALVYAGFLFIKAQGQPAELEKARSAFFWGVVGGVIVLGAKGLALAIESTVSELRK